MSEHDEDVLIVHRPLIHAFGLDSAVFISAVLTHMEHLNDWVPMFKKRMEEETGLSIERQKKVRGWLRRNSILKIKRINRQTFYNIDLDMLYECMENIACGPYKSVVSHACAKNNTTFSKNRIPSGIPFINVVNNKKSLEGDTLKKVFSSLGDTITPKSLYKAWQILSKALGMKKCSYLDSTLSRKLSLRINEISPSQWETLFREVITNEWLPTQAWFTLDWIAKNSSNARKVIEGQYTQSKKKKMPANAFTDGSKERLLADARRKSIRCKRK